MKTCTACSQPKALEEFYHQKGNLDGRAGKCKVCVKAYMSRRYWENREEMIARDRERNKRRKPYLSGRTKLRRDRHPLQATANNAVSNALRDGRLSRQPCEKCGTTERVEGHHEDYSKPLAVNWLCRKHHLEHHGKIAW